MREFKYAHLEYDPMIRFLGTSETLVKAKELLQVCDEAYMAIAFWGRGAKDQLGLTEGHAGRVTIICDPESGACNPYAIKELLKLGINVIAKKNLHAKVFWTQNAAIVGSSNVSANGLGFEGSELSANIEANLLTNDPGVLLGIRTWIENDVLPGREIDDVLLERCREAWCRRQRSRHALTTFSSNKESNNFSNLAKDSPDFFRFQAIEIWAFFEANTSKKSDHLTEIAQKIYKNENIAQFEVLAKPRVRSGVTVLWFSRSGNGKQKFEGIYKTIEVPPQKTVREGSRYYYNHYVVPANRKYLGRQIDAPFLTNIGRLVDAKFPRRDSQLLLPLSEIVGSAAE